VYVANVGGSLQFIPVTQTVGAPITSACWLAAVLRGSVQIIHSGAYLVPHDRQIIITVI
jgi:hypothetical protein